MEQVATYEQIVAINVDVQNDFCPGGALAVNEGDLVVPPLNQVNEFVREQDGDVIFTADWHPRKTAHFIEGGGPWPPHCVRFTAGAAFHNNLVIEPVDTVALKGTGTVDDGYSGWGAEFDEESQLYEEGQLLYGGGGLATETIFAVGQAVENMARQRKVAVVIGGLATDYCVKATVMDALNANVDNLDVYVLEDAIRAVDVEPGDGDRAITEMKEAGAKFVTSDQLINGQVLEIVR